VKSVVLWSTVTLQNSVALQKSVALQYYVALARSLWLPSRKPSMPLKIKGATSSINSIHGHGCDMLDYDAT